MNSSWFKQVWRLALTAITVLIFFMAIRALYRLTKTVHYQDVLDAIAHIPTFHLIIAAIVVAFGYLVLTLYDFIALRQLGKKLDYPHVALTSFTAYAISHTIGLNLVTASGIRYRNYRRFNLTHNEIANIVWMVSMAFTFGITTLIGASLTSHPEITIQLLSELDKSLGIFEHTFYVRVLGIIMLSVIAAIIVYAGKQGKHVVIRGWRFDLPPAKILLQQIAIAILDLSTVALVLYLLLPPSEHISYWATFSAFIQSIAIGILSHVPGGLGVFEVVMITALPKVDRTQMLAVLLIFRLLYYIMPFLVALLALLVYEAKLYLSENSDKKK
ncbi:UPF0104 family protein [Moraxella osloensis]|nr:lysylphosphatidylglycerol synthase domain-containing protein [Moraxella osloensis]QRO12538.1 UPF0104 family protein [Moraxella osloensis]